MELNKRTLERVGMIILGNLSYAAGVNLMINPIHLYSGGFTGIAQLIRMLLLDVLHLPQIGGIDYMGVIYFLLNVPFFLMAYRIMGRKFCITTLISIAMASVCLAIIPVPATPIVDDRILASLVGGLGSGFGAGLVLSAAFEHIVEESRQTDSLADDYFYSCMAEIDHKIRETNSSLEIEFRAFARSSECSGKGSRELMRISNIISDNISKGAELTDKLQSESEALWLSRKSDSEERGRLAETKLTMPLTVFLLVLVVVTVSPALLEL